MLLQKYIDGLPEGYSEVIFEGRRHGVSVSTHNGGRSYKVFARNLGGRGYISFNYYRTGVNELLRPCEMPKDRVIRFLKNYKLCTADADS
jgi:hypothetical protein